MDREEIGTPEKKKKKTQTCSGINTLGRRCVQSQKNQKKEKVETNLLSLVSRISLVTFDKRSFLK